MNDPIKTPILLLQRFDIRNLEFLKPLQLTLYDRPSLFSHWGNP